MITLITSQNSQSVSAKRDTEQRQNGMTPQKLKRQKSVLEIDSSQNSDVEGDLSNRFQEAATDATMETQSWDEGSGNDTDSNDSMTSKPRAAGWMS